MSDLIPLDKPSVYAGFWRRFNAYGIDATFVVIIAWLISYFLLSSPAVAQTTQAMPQDFEQLMQLSNALATGQISPEVRQMIQAALFDSMFGGSVLPGLDQFTTIAVSTLYNVFFVIGRWQATPGKHWLGMKVVRADGGRLTLLESLTRHALSGVSMLPLGLGCVTVAFTREKLAPHDMICHTRVIRTNL